MALPLIMGGLQLASSLSGNEQANANAKNQFAQAYRNFGIQTNNIVQAGKELNREAGMALTSAKLEGLKQQGSTTNRIVESGVVGNTARRITNNVDMQNTLYSNQIKQKAEAGMRDIGTKLSNAKLNYDNQTAQISDNLANNTASPFEMMVGVGKAYVGGGGSVNSFDTFTDLFN